MTATELYAYWQSQDLDDPDLEKELISIRENQQEIYERFYMGLEFGTGGLRGTIGAGTNRMNIYVIRQTTQALCNYIKDGASKPKVAVAYDSRIKSDLFAKTTASVFAANGIKVYIYEALMPTPMLSYAVRALHCDAGVIVTASHNPAQYNGFKVYDGAGCQIGPETADQVQAYIQQTDPFVDVKTVDFEAALADGAVEYISHELIESYYKAVLSQQVNPGVTKQAGLKLVYTPLNGAGNVPVREILGRVGVGHIAVVPEQEMPDGNFTTCPYPNPEIREALDLGLKLCQEKNADMLLATDPDCDRVGIAVKGEDGYELISGNEVGAMLMEYICSCRVANGTMPQNPVAVKSIVSTQLAAFIAKDYGVELRDVLTGFKFIGEQMELLAGAGEVDRFILGFEESYGYLVGDYARDKDAVVASMLICEMASYYKQQGKSLIWLRDELYAKYGYFLHNVDSFAFEGSTGMEKMKEMMSSLRETPIHAIDGVKVSGYKDYLTSEATDAQGQKTVLQLPKSNVLAYELETGDSFIIRPSGTEPKIKLYFTNIASNRAGALAGYSKISKAVAELLKL